MDLKKLSDKELIVETKRAVKVELESTAAVIKRFQEVYDRKLHLKHGFKNFYEMAADEFGYTTGAAMRRINSMRLIQVLPEVEAKIESGELKLTVAANVQSFFYAEETKDRPYSQSAKIELIETCLNKSVAEVERELCRRSPEREKRESVQRVTENRVRLSLTISDDLNRKFQKLKNLLAHAEPNMTTEDLLERLTELGLDKFDPFRKAKRAELRAAKQIENLPPSMEASVANQTTSILNTVEAKLPPSAEVKPANSISPANHSRYIKSHDRHSLMRAWDGNGCCYIDPQTKRRCGSHRFLQIDHVKPHSHGGSNEAQNLRILCGQHNRWNWKTGSRESVALSR